MLDFIKDIPEHTGIGSDRIIHFIERLRKKEIPMHSILLLHHDKLIAEGYYAPYTKHTLHRMFSISKSFTSVAIGLLADEGKLSLDDPIVTYFPDKVPENAHPWISSMTIRDMLMMRTCHASTTYKVNMKQDWVESFFTVPPTHPAGKIFHYDTSSAHTLCALAERLSGMKMLDYLKAKLAPLGLSEESYMISDPFGVSIGGSGLVAFPMDLLKFGYLIFHEGNIQGEQLISPSYVKEAVSNLTATKVTAPLPSEACGYGYQFWRNEKDGYVCYGMGGQFILFLPDYDLICVTTADTQGIGGGNQVIYDALYEEILPYISSKPLPESNKSYTELTNILENLSLEPLKGMFSSPLMEQAAGKNYLISENTPGFSNIRIEFFDVLPDTCKLTGQTGGGRSGGILYFTLRGTEYSLSFGFGDLVNGLFPVYHMAYAASGVWLDADTLYIKAHIIDAYVGSVHFELAFGKDDVTVFLKKQEESLFTEFNGHLYGKSEP